MKNIILIYFIITLVAIYFYITLIKNLKKNKIEMPNKIHRFNTSDGHGLKTLMNGLKNIRPLILFNWLLMGLISLSNLLQVPDAVNYFTIILKLLIFISMCSYSYKISEIKHLSDEVSKTLESDIFYIKYSMFGILGFLADFTIMILLKYSFLEPIVILMLFMLIFILGMGDLLNVSGINKFDIKVNLTEPLRHCFEIPVKITRAILIKDHRDKFKDTLSHNLTHIFKGFKIGIKKFKLLYSQKQKNRR